MTHQGPLCGAKETPAVSAAAIGTGGMSIGWKSGGWGESAGLALSFSDAAAEAATVARSAVRTHRTAGRPRKINDCDMGCRRTRMAAFLIPLSWTPFSPQRFPDFSPLAGAAGW